MTGILMRLRRLKWTRIHINELDFLVWTCIVRLKLRRWDKHFVICLPRTNIMASLDMKTDPRPSTNGEPAFTLCTFCNNSTNGFEKRLFATTQPKGPFFPVLAEVQGKKTTLDSLGRAVVCVACFHHLLRQWSSFERRGVPLRRREYNIISGMRFMVLCIYKMAPSKLSGFFNSWKSFVARSFCYLHGYWFRLLATGRLCL